MKDFRMTPEVLRQIHQSIGSRKPETGGFLGSTDGLTIDQYYFDETAVTSGTTYTPDVLAVNQTLSRWRQIGVKPVGNIHSHPTGCTHPSIGDIAYAQQIMDAWETDSFLIVIAAKQAFRGSRMKLYPYRISADGTVQKIPLRYENPEERFQRVKGLYPLDVLKKKTAVVIGVGGAAGFAEDLARSGVTRFVLIDPDTYSITNIATQQCFGNDVGRAKVDVVKERILDINPAAIVTAARRSLDDAFSDEDFAVLVGDELLSSPKDVLLCGCTDSFMAQARTAALALKYGTPYLAAQLYAGGEAGEIYFSYPGATTGGCPRCAMRSRYEAYEQGYQNTTTSAGSPIFATTQLNAMKGQIAMMLLLHGEETGGRFGTMLQHVADRNFIQLRFSPSAEEHLGLHIFHDAVRTELSFFGETVWIPQMPERDCALCHGEANLLALKGKIADTRRLT